jgi:multisubunit Na+/H+ antiporter MnhC subunit
MLEPKIVLFLAAVLFCAGMYGVLSRRHLIMLLMSLELMLNAVNIMLVTFSRHWAGRADTTAIGMPPAQAYSRPFALPAGTPFQLTSAMRWDLIVKPTTPGTFLATIDFLNQITGEKLYTATTTITVTP